MVSHKAKAKYKAAETGALAHVVRLQIAVEQMRLSYGPAHYHYTRFHSDSIIV